MSKQYDNRNRFILFKNDRKQDDKHPDYTGTYTNEGGQDFYMDAWVKEGAKGKFMSGKIGKPKPAGKAQVRTQQRNNEPDI